MRPYETSTPFQRPHNVATTSGTRMTAHIGAQLYPGSLIRSPILPDRFVPRMLGLSMMQATEDEIAMTAPTDRSTPPVAITSVIPIARITVGALFRRTSIRFP